MKVMIALDASDGALDAARAAVALLAPADATFVVLNVADVPVQWAGPGPGMTTFAPFELTELDPELEQRVHERVAHDADAAGVPDPQVEVVTGDPVLEICRAADRHEVDLIVVGAHDRSLLARLFAPSVTEGVVTHASQPVLVVPRRA